MRFINDDVQVKNGRRAAVRLSAEDLAHLMYQRANELVQQEWGASEHLERPDDGAWCYGECYSDLVQHLMHDASLLADLQQNGVSCCSETTFDGCESKGAVNLTGMHTLENGLTFYGFFNSVDCGPSCAFVIIYYDGHRLRAYVPTRGNTINVDVPCVIGTEEFHPCPLEAQYRDLGIWQEDEDLFRMYLAKYGISEPFCYWDAIQEDIETNITVCDTTPPPTPTPPPQSPVITSAPSTCNIPFIFTMWFLSCAKTPDKVIKLRCWNIHSNQETCITYTGGEFHATGNAEHIVNEYIDITSVCDCDVNTILMNLCDALFTHAEIITEEPLEDVNTAESDYTNITPELQGMLALFKEFEQQAHQHPKQAATLSFLLTNGKYSYVTHRADDSYTITGEIPEVLSTMVTNTGALQTVNPFILMSAYTDIMVDYDITIE